jgi:hypothetical protein
MFLILIGLRRAVSVRENSTDRSESRDVMKSWRAVLVTTIMATVFVGISAAPSSAEPRGGAGTDCGDLTQQIQLMDSEVDFWDAMAGIYAAQNDMANLDRAIDNSRFFQLDVAGLRAVAHNNGCV